MHVERIASARNRQFKQWLAWTREPQAVDCPWIAVEGRKQALEQSVRTAPELVLFENRDATIEVLASRARQAVQLPAHLLGRLSRVVSPQGVIAFFQKPAWDWPSVTQRLLYLEDIQDPGNVGTLLRTAQATGLFTVVTGEGSVSLYNPKVVRASSGALFTVPFLQGVSVQEVSDRGYEIIACSPDGDENVLPGHFSPPFAFVLGNEGGGIRQRTLKTASRVVRIPMEAGAESLSVAVAGSLIMYQIYLQER